jgi:hypothetical protein
MRCLLLPVSLVIIRPPFPHHELQVSSCSISPKRSPIAPDSNGLIRVDDPKFQGTILSIGQGEEETFGGEVEVRIPVALVVGRRGKGDRSVGT